MEGEARKQFRKWDNVKYIAESTTKRMISKDSYRNKNWGMEINTNNRLNLPITLCNENQSVTAHWAA